MSAPHLHLWKLEEKLCVSSGDVTVKSVCVCVFCTISVETRKIPRTQPFWALTLTLPTSAGLWSVWRVEASPGGCV